MYSPLRSTPSLMGDSLFHSIWRMRTNQQPLTVRTHIHVSNFTPFLFPFFDFEVFCAPEEDAEQVFKAWASASRREISLCWSLKHFQLLFPYILMFLNIQYYHLNSLFVKLRQQHTSYFIHISSIFYPYFTHILTIFHPYLTHSSPIF